MRKIVLEYIHYYNCVRIQEKLNHLSLKNLGNKWFRCFDWCPVFGVHFKITRFLASQERFELPLRPFRTILYILIAVLIYLLLRECLPIPSSHFYDSPIRVSFITDVLYCKVAVTIFPLTFCQFLR